MPKIVKTVADCKLILQPRGRGDVYEYMTYDHDRLLRVLPATI